MPLRVAAVGEKVERELALAGGFVDRLDRLEGQRHAHGRDALAVGAILAVPHQLRHASLLPLHNSLSWSKYSSMRAIDAHPYHFIHLLQCGAVVQGRPIV